MRTAAALLNPKAADAVFEDVRFVSPLKIFKDDPFLAEVEVIRAPSETEGQSSTYHARIFSWFVDRNGQKVGSARLHHECRLAVGNADPSQSV